MKTREERKSYEEVQSEVFKQFNEWWDERKKIFNIIIVLSVISLVFSIMVFVLLLLLAAQVL